MTDTNRKELIAKFFEKQYWQFISLDEWLDVQRNAAEPQPAESGKDD